MEAPIKELTKLARYGGFTGIRTGACAPQATVLQSYGSACPTGYCPPNELPVHLNRWFAGERSGCREMPYPFSFSGAASGTAVVINGQGIVDFCPTRLVAVEIGSAGVGLVNWSVNSIRFGNEEQLVGGPVRATAFAPDAVQPVPLVPACLRAGQPFTISATPDLVTAPGDTILYLVFFGPAVG